jgi:hypothetical protein
MQGNIRDQLFRPELIKRIVIYSLLTLVLGSAQCSFFPLLKISPSTPDLIMGMLLGVMLIDSEKSAAPLAIGAGFFLDAIGGTSVAYLTVLYLFYVLFIGFFAQKMLAGFVPYLILLLPTLLYRAFATFICMTVANGALPTLSAALGVIIPELVCTAVFCLPIYAIVKLCTMPLETHGRFTF